jgi:hypothetical protein
MFMMLQISLLYFSVQLKRVQNNDTCISEYKRIKSS